jgi:hypothetical protein
MKEVITNIQKISYEHHMTDPMAPAIRDPAEAPLITLGSKPSAQRVFASPI